MALTIKPLDEADVAAADDIFCSAFSTFLGLPDPGMFRSGASVIATRWRADRQAALGAYADGLLIGSSFATRRGSFGFVGPVSVRPDLWGQGVAQQLMRHTISLLDQPAITQMALFTFPQSAKHIALYQKFEFWPQYLTSVMSKPTSTPATRQHWSRHSALSPAERAHCLGQCAELTGSVYPGLDLGSEIRAIADQRLGETILIHDAAGLAGFACCHLGAGSEAGTDTAFVKFGAVRPGTDAPELFGQLLDSCEALACETGSTQLVAGISTARHQAYRQMLDRGFRTFLQGVAMFRPNEPAFNRPDCFVMDDLR